MENIYYLQMNKNKAAYKTIQTFKTLEDALKAFDQIPLSPKQSKRIMDIGGISIKREAWTKIN